MRNKCGHSLDRSGIEGLTLECSQDIVRDLLAQFGKLPRIEGRQGIKPGNVVTPRLRGMGCATWIVKTLVLGAKEALRGVVERPQAERSTIWPRHDQGVGTLTAVRHGLTREPADKVLIILDVRPCDTQFQVQVDKSHQQARREFTSGKARSELLKKLVRRHRYATCNTDSCPKASCANA